MKKCKFNGCNRDHAAKGYCKTHHRQWKQFGYTKEIRETILGQIGCKVNDCENKHSAKGYCKRHHSQIYHYGKIKRYTTKDPNKFTFKDNICEIELYDKDGNVKAKAIIDKDDYEKCKNIKWGLQSGRCQYVKNVKAGFLHHHIWGKKVQLDHINRDKLDCRKSNLREATCQQNAWNKGMQSNNTSGITGVRWSKRLQKWRAQIFINGKNKHLGLFHDKNDAITARNNAVKKYYGSFGLTLER